MAKSNVGRKGFISAHSSTSQSIMKEVRTETETQELKAQVVEECLLSLLSSALQEHLPRDAIMGRAHYINQ